MQVYMYMYIYVLLTVHIQHCLLLIGQQLGLNNVSGTTEISEILGRLHC